MNVNFKVNDRVNISFDADQVRDVFEQLVVLDEVFGRLEFTSKDGKFTTKNVVLSVRIDSEDNKYYEAVVMEPGPYKYAKKKFGAHKKGGGLFPKKEEGHVSYWVKYNKETGKEEEI